MLLDRFLSCFFLMLFLGFRCIQSAEEKPMVIFIPSYNNSAWCKDNLKSTIQDYSNYRIIYVDDCSTDTTLQEVEAFKQEFPEHAQKITVIKNSERQGALANAFMVISACADQEIVVFLDGDDFLSGKDVLKKLNQVYSSPDVWLTYGSLTMWPHTGSAFHAHRIPEEFIQSHDGIRRWPYAATHLRTFYAGLFKKIQKESLLYEGEFYSMAWDIALMTPMLEMARERHTFITDILYVYNTSNPISDHNVNRGLQLRLHNHIQELAPYERLQNLWN